MRKLLRWTVTAAAVCVLVGSVRAAVPEAYRRLWDDPALQKRIDEGIERHRKGGAVVRLLGADGQPRAGVPVRLAQRTHAFLFGCNLFVLGQLDTPEANRTYEERFLGLFNFATLPFYWAGTEPTQGELRYEEGARRIWRRPPPQRLVAWCKAHGVAAKGHPLLWHQHNPPWLPKDRAALERLYVKRFGEIADRYAAAVRIWDVVNESLVCPKSFPLMSDDRAYVAWAFEQAHRVFRPDDLLMINEVTSFSGRPGEGNPYYRQVKRLLDDGVGIEGIGFQFHLFNAGALQGHLDGKTLRPAAMLDVYELFAGLDRPLYVTEITIPTAGPDGPAVQAAVVRNLYRLWFSAPRMAGITWWNLGDGLAVKGENAAGGGLLNEDLQPKPSYLALDRLINHDWKTRLEARTDAGGEVRFRGFFGAYDVTVAVPGGPERFTFEHTPSGTGVHEHVVGATARSER
jgi:GH35 family endo-1,4-beta-xylanase